MLITDNSTHNDLLEALAGQWNVTKDVKNDLAIAECGVLKIIQWKVKAGSNPIPFKYNTVLPYTLFTASGITGGVLKLQNPGVETAFNSPSAGILQIIQLMV